MPAPVAVVNTPLWLEGTKSEYPSLSGDLSVDVAVIVGGEGHKPGTDPDTGSRYARLEAFLAERFGAAAAEYRWSRHDYTPVDGLPYIGRLRRGEERILVATGFAKWGMTKGTIAAGVLADAVLGRPNEYADMYDANRLDARRSAAAFAKENGRVAVAFFRDRVRPRDGRAEIDDLAPGEAPSPGCTAGTTPSTGPRTARSAPSRRAARTSVASSAGTVPTRPGSARATARASPRTARSSRAPRRRISRRGRCRTEPQPRAGPTRRAWQDSNLRPAA
jgi:hypothetical protein